MFLADDYCSLDGVLVDVAMLQFCNRVCYNDSVV